MLDADASTGFLPPFGGPEAETRIGARVCVFPVPFEATVSYGGGTANGPAAILRASTQVELYDEQLRSEPFRAGIRTEPPFHPGLGTTESAVRSVEARFGNLMDEGLFVVMLGGEHSITSGGVAAAAARHPGLVVVQIDAHADLREAYEGDRFSHASAMARCLDVAEVHAYGIRNYSAEEAERIRRGIPGYRIVHAWEMAGDEWMSPAVEAVRDRPVYLTVDVDGFDPSVVPATGTPEPGGMLWWPTMRFLGRLFGAARVVAADVVELAPIEGLHHADFAAARLVYKIAGFHAAGGPSRGPEPPSVRSAPNG